MSQRSRFASAAKHCRGKRKMEFRSCMRHELSHR